VFDYIVGAGDGGGLTCIYFAMLAVGVIYAIVILIGSGMGEGAGHFGGDMGGDFTGDFGGDIAGHDFDLSGHDLAGGDPTQGSIELTHISPVTIAGFVTAFGAFGLISQGLFSASTGASLIWATIGGVLIGLASHLAFIYFFIKPQGSSEVTDRDVVGARGEIITPIPPGGVGAVAFIAQGGRVTATARSEDGSAIPRGSAVRIVEKIGSVVVVGPVPGRAPTGTTTDSPADEGEDGA